MVIVWGSIEAREEALETLRQLSVAHVHRSRREPGCISHSVHTDVENPLRLVFYEEWQDMPALQAHFEVAESRKFLDKATKLATTPPTMKIFQSTQIG